MTLARRVAQLEGSLSPQQAVLAWLAEAHAFPTLGEYVRSLLDGPETAWPLVRIPAQVAAAVRAQQRRAPIAVIVTAIRVAILDVVTLVELVLVSNLAAERLLASATASLTLLERYRPLGTGSLVGHWRRDVELITAELAVEAAARQAVERRYLGGHDVLFPGLAARCSETEARITALVPPRSRRTPMPAARSARQAAALVRMASAAAYGLVGDRASSIALVESGLTQVQAAATA